jgi:hypothetical protein
MEVDSMEAGRIPGTQDRPQEDVRAHARSGGGTTPARRSRPAAFPGWVLLLGAALLGMAGSSRADVLVTNAGGVFVLHAPSMNPWEPGTVDACEQAPPASLSQVQTRLPADGVPRLVILYAYFPPDSSALVLGTCFGIRYSKNVKVWSYGACTSGGFELPNDGWPASGGGNSVANSHAKLAESGKPVSIYWFAVSAKGPGFFETTPNPGQNFGGKFGNTDIPAHLEPIAGYGKIGFDLDGFAPAPGHPAVKGACCTDACWPLSEIECTFFKGIFLGPGATCTNEPCGPTPLTGACCLATGCEMFSLLDCAKMHGISLGEGVSCGSRPCPTGRAGGDSLGTGEAKPETPHGAVAPDSVRVGKAK